MKIMDLCCGDGINYAALVDSFQIDSSNYYALDVDEKSLAVCRKRGVKNILKEYFQPETVKKINAKFDLIIATEVLEHQTNPSVFSRRFLLFCEKTGS
jgi:2-polyprenyl-3-methyl-5-hydroxy-6-metoxy-1,4-benzoquinol methylase